VGFSSANFTLTLGNITTPQQIIAAPAAGILTIPWLWVIRSITTTASGGGAPIFRCRYNGVAIDLLGQINSGANAIRDFIGQGVAAGVAGQNYATYGAGLAVMADATTDAGAPYVGTCGGTVYYIQVTI